MVASKCGHTNIIQLLLEHGADANLQNEVSSSAKIVCDMLWACGGKLCDVSCLSEYECLALSKLAPRPCYV